MPQNCKKTQTDATGAAARLESRLQKLEATVEDVPIGAGDIWELFEFASGKKAASTDQ